jgi:hypothetical protein
MSRSFGCADDETDRGGSAAAEIQGAKGFRILDLVLAGRAANLFGRVDQHPQSRRADRVATADQPAALVRFRAKTLW